MQGKCRCAEVFEVSRRDIFVSAWIDEVFSAARLLITHVFSRFGAARN
jgi:hypothetical protein